MFYEKNYFNNIVGYLNQFVPMFVVENFCNNQIGIKTKAGDD